MDVFVYGTLTDAETAASVLETFEYGETVTVEGVHRVDGEYPTLAPGGTTTGRILTTPEIDRLDRYEGVEHGLYVRLPLPRAGGGRVETYVGHPRRLGVSDEWPGDGPFAERVSGYLETNDVVVG